MAAQPGKVKKLINGFHRVIMLETTIKEGLLST